LFHLSNYSKKTSSKKVELSAREKSRLITQGKIPHQFLGKKGSAVYQQEFFSFVNLKDPFRDHNWRQKFKVLCEEMQKDNPELLESLKVKYQKFNPTLK
jgi:hypothetical protein